MNTTAANQFWKWFVENEQWIIDNIHTNGMDVVWAVDARIKPVFPYFKKELEFELGYNNGVGEFSFSTLAIENLFLMHRNSKSLCPNHFVGTGCLLQKNKVTALS